MPSETMNSTPNLEWQDEQGVFHQRELNAKIFIGRFCRGIDNDHRIIIRNPTVSRDHAVVRLTSYGVKITDLSKNGTWVNNVRMAAGASRKLLDGDVISVGGMSIRFTHPDNGMKSREETGSERTAAAPMPVFVTSLVADIRGFSGFSQKSDSENVYVFLEEIFTRFSAIVNEHNGTIKDYAGDAVFAFWEHPKMFSAEHALWACQAAISQLESVPEITRRLQAKGLELSPPKLGWGLTTGHGILSHFGDRAADIAVVGDSINLAFRLSSMANKTLSASIVVCRQTAKLVRQALPLEELGDYEIRGRNGKESLFGIQLE